MALRPQHVAPEILNKVTKALGITALDQWYYVSHHTASKAIGSRVLNQFGGSLSSFLKHAYPEHHFEEEKLIPRIHTEKDQQFFEVIIRKLFPDAEIHTKARKAVGVINPETGAYLEIDIWIPSLKLGIEYQDKHHYEYQWYANYTLEEYQKRDNVKKDAMSKLGYTLVTIGYWWDKRIESVAATIRKVRPDLLLDYEHDGAESIASEPPLGYISEVPAIPGIAGLMNPFIPSYNFNPTNWYAGEKYDGIRGVFNPNLNKMFSRYGNELSVLSSLLKDIPNTLAEGEVVAGRGNYAKTAPISCNTHHDKVNWPMFRYVVFDIPDATLGNYTQRYSAIVSGLTRPFVFAQLALRALIGNKDHLKMFMDAIISDAGEGVIAQQDLVYEYGRAKGLAKIKVRRDADAQVLLVNARSCTCKLASGVTAEISYAEDFNPSNLNVGDLISYYHKGHSQSGKPQLGEVYKIRYDITWEQLLAETKSRNVKDAIGSRSLFVLNQARNKMGHWNNSINVRAFFDEYAKTTGFDPLVPENWYRVRYSTLQNSKKGSGLLRAHGFNMKKALSCAYPDLQFEQEKIRSRARRGHWNESRNVREFFDQYARKSGFNPLEPENWYSVTVGELLNAGGSGPLNVYGNIANGISSVYPELKFENAKFETHGHAMKGRWWNKSSNVRAFFDAFAKTTGFDPHVPENWNSVRHSTLQIAKGGGILQAYGYNIKKALSNAYPELQFGPIS